MKRALIHGVSILAGFALILAIAISQRPHPKNLNANLPYDAATCPVGDNAVYSAQGDTALYGFSTIGAAWDFYQPKILPNLAVPRSTFVIVGTPSATQAQMADLDLAGSPLAIADFFKGSTGDGNSGWYVENVEACSTVLSNPIETHITEAQGTATGTPTPQPIPTR